MMVCTQIHSSHLLFLLGTSAVFSCLHLKQVSLLNLCSCLGSHTLQRNMKTSLGTTVHLIRLLQTMLESAQANGELKSTVSTALRLACQFHITKIRIMLKVRVVT